MEKLQLTGRNLDSFSTLGVAICMLRIYVKLPNLKWKTHLKQLLGSIPLDTTLPRQNHLVFCA